MICDPVALASRCARKPSVSPYSIQQAHYSPLLRPRRASPRSVPTPFQHSAAVTAAGARRDRLARRQAAPANTGGMSAVNRVLALDFDGVVCDSVGESALSAWRVRASVRARRWRSPPRVPPRRRPERCDLPFACAAVRRPGRPYGLKSSRRRLPRPRKTGARSLALPTSIRGGGGARLLHPAIPTPTGHAHALTQVRWTQTKNGRCSRACIVDPTQGCGGNAHRPPGRRDRLRKHRAGADTVRGNAHVVSCPLEMMRIAVSVSAGPHPARAAVHSAADARWVGVRSTAPARPPRRTHTPRHIDACVSALYRCAAWRLQGDASSVHEAVGPREEASRRPLREVPRWALVTTAPELS